jgi:hypothetical protein
MNPTQVTFTLTIEQANLVLASLGQRPYAEVADLINSLKADAQKQLATAQVEASEPIED